MISLPIELEYYILSFNPSNRACINVCKSWNTEMNLLRSDAATKIATWYRYNKIPKNITTVTGCIRAMIIAEFDEYYISFPERTFTVLNLHPACLEVLPPIIVRRRSHVRDWMKALPLGLDEWLSVLIM